jgi:FKBP-type peptidyl-prolyl cis-trans isomerase
MHDGLRGGWAWKKNNNLMEKDLTMHKTAVFLWVFTSILCIGCKTNPPPAEGKKEAITEEPARRAAKQEQAAPSPQVAENDIPAPPDVAAPPADSTKTASGLASKVIKPGTGTVHPKADDNVEVHYSGWTTDGKMFDSSVKRGSTATFPLNRVIAGWTEGVQLMVVGEKRRFWIPEALAYQGRPGAPQGMLVFDVELIGIK